jgi:hypothetical protein
VWIEDEHYATGMMLDGKLEQFHSCPTCSEEGFSKDFEAHGNDCCRDYLQLHRDYIADWTTT